MNKEPGKIEPSAERAILGATAVSRARLMAFVLVFQRWAASECRNTVVPPGFLELLRMYVLEPEIKLDLDEAFHLARSREIRDSSSAIGIFEFSTGRLESETEATPDTPSAKVRYIRSYDNDLHILNVQSGEVNSAEGRWMTGTRESTSSFERLLPYPPPQNALDLLREHWVAPQRWLSEGRAVIVRPRGKDADAGALRAAAGVTLCDAARRVLAEGLTLLLVVGDLVRVDLPGGLVLLFAGMMWEEGKPQKANAGRKKRPDKLAFIIAERAARGGFKGRKEDKDEESHWRQRNNPLEQFEENMYVWHRQDIYTYIPDLWM